MLPNLSLYIHWPFCQHKCPYCDFNSYASKTHDCEDFGRALCEEMTHMSKLIPTKRALTSIFFGGGTPSLMPPSIVGAIIDHAEKTFGFKAEIEITAEANPTSVEVRSIVDFYHAGVNRISMGVQSLDNNILKFLGRKHSVSDALSALEVVRRYFDNLSIDLIYATINQTCESWEADLFTALHLDLPHLSLYQLTVEPGTVFHLRQRNGESLTADDDLAADLYEVTRSLTTNAGLLSYEISNYAKSGAECLHNLNYWQSGDWIGVGPGAHGRFIKMNNNYERLQRIGTVTLHNPVNWLQSVRQFGHGIETQSSDCADYFASEMMMMGLRLSKGVDLKKIEALCGAQTQWLDMSAILVAIKAGWLNAKYDAKSSKIEHLRVTPKGRLRLNNILTMILR